MRSGFQSSLIGVISAGLVFAGCTGGFMCSSAGGAAQPTTIGQTPAAPAPLPNPTRSGTGFTYYVSPKGKDSNSGTSAGAPWQSMAKVNAFKFGAGSSVLFEGGQSFTGCLTFSFRNISSSSTSNPFTVSSYGTGRATLLSNCPGSNNGGNGPKSALVTIDGVSGFVLENLILMGSGNNTQFGIVLQNSNASLTADTITVQNNDISGFTTTAALDYSAEIFLTGYSMLGVCGALNRVKILNNTLHGAYGVNSNDDNGIDGYSCSGNLTNIIYSGNTIYDIGGRAKALGGVSGNGIIANGVRGATAEYNVVHDVGGNANTCGGPAGLWAYASDRVIIQHNEVYNVRPTGPVPSGACDWDGFDLDGNVTNSIVQYNYAHDNYGGGIITCAACASGDWGPNTIRYNVLQNNDTSGNGYYGEIVASSKVSGRYVLNIYNNTAYNNNGAAVLDFNQGTFAAGVIANNVFMAAGTNHYGQTTLMATNHEDPTWATIANNVWFSTGGGTPIWATNSTNYSSFAAYQAGTGWDIGSQNVDPLLTNPGHGGTCGSITGPQPCPSAYVSLAASPLIGTGLDLTGSPYHLTIGTHDYYGNAIPERGRYNVGAFGGRQ